MQETYIDKYHPWMDILASNIFKNFSVKNRLKGYSMGQLIFLCDMITPIRNNVDLELVCQKNQTQTNYDSNCYKLNRVDYDYKFGKNVMLKNKADYR